MASIAGNVFSVGGCRQARCFKEKRARNRRARGSVSAVRVLRNGVTTGSKGADIMVVMNSDSCMRSSEMTGLQIISGRFNPQT